MRSSRDFVRPSYASTPKNEEFALSEIRFLGQIVKKDGISIDHSKDAAILEFPRPKNVKQVRQILGLCGYWRRYIEGYARIVHPLNKLLQKSVPFVWSDECENAFNKLKTALTTAPILRFPDLNKEFTLVTDASTTAIGYYLTQLGHDGRPRVISYAGSGLMSYEIRFAASEVELLAIMQGIRHFHTYLANNKITVISDHVSSKYITSLRAEYGRLGRWAMYLMNYNFEIMQAPGASGVIRVADGLSRREYSPENGKKLKKSSKTIYWHLEL